MGDPEIDPKAAAINEYQRLMMQHKVRVSSFIAPLGPTRAIARDRPARDASPPSRSRLVVRR